MKVYTKRGDKGETSLIGGTRVKKSHVRIESYGTVDELNSCIGVIRDTGDSDRVNQFLVEIQNRLFTIGSELATDPEARNVKTPILVLEDTEALENEIDRMEEELPPLKNFILPGGDLAASYCHIARTVCRRAERKAIELNELSPVEDKILGYLNRLSDYLFVLSRYYTHLNKGIETPWKPRG